MTSISYSSFGPTIIISWCHIYYITSVILYFFSGYVTGNKYYVSATFNRVPCITTDLFCHNLSYYVAEYHSYFADDTIFYFLEGTHTLQGILGITNISYITLQRQGHIEQGFHKTVFQSTSVIMCSDNKRVVGIQFTTSKHIVIKSLTIANCVFDAYISNKKIVNSLYFGDIKDVTLEWVSVQNGSGYRLCLVNNFDVLIANSLFVNNNGEGMLIYSYGNGNIEFNNWTIYNNNAKHHEGGISINLYRRDSIEFNNYTIHNNKAQHTGGGVYINLHGNGNIEFNYCTIYNNIVQKSKAVEEEECPFTQSMVVLNSMTALYTTIQVSMLEEEEH